jgi:hypothetical protein
MKLTEVDSSVKDYQTIEHTYFIGYQVIDKFNKRLEWPSDPRTRVKTDRWITDKRKGFIFSESGDIYELGFHVYLQPIDDKMCRKVYYREPVAYGYDNKEFMVVAKHILIPSKV